MRKNLLRLGKEGAKVKIFTEVLRYFFRTQIYAKARNARVNEASKDVNDPLNRERKIIPGFY